ncbi:hypothetical protein EMCRGX_G028236 [Ephydatia muelleri]
MKSEKFIYQPGTLRKLSTTALELGTIKMTIQGRSTILLSQAIASCTLLMPPSLKSSTRQEIGLFWEVSKLVKFRLYCPSSGARNSYSSRLYT